MSRNPWSPPEAKLADNSEPDRRKPLAIWILQGLLALGSLGLLIRAANEARLWMAVPWYENRGEILASCLVTTTLAILCAWLLYGIQRRSPIARWLAAILQAATLAVSIYVFITFPVSVTTRAGLAGALTAVVLILVPQVVLFFMASFSARARDYYSRPPPEPARS